MTSHFPNVTDFKIITVRSNNKFIISWNTSDNGYISLVDITNLDDIIITDLTPHFPGFYFGMKIVLINEDKFIFYWSVMGIYKISLVDITSGINVTDISVKLPDFTVGFSFINGISSIGDNNKCIISYTCSTGKFISLVDITNLDDIIDLTSHFSDYEGGNATLISDNNYIVRWSANDINYISLVDITNLDNIIDLTSNFPTVHDFTIINNTKLIICWSTNDIGYISLVDITNPDDINIMDLTYNFIDFKQGIAITKVDTDNFIVSWFNSAYSYNISLLKLLETLPCFLADSKVLTDKGLTSIQLLKKGDLVQTLNDGLLPVKFVGMRSFFNKLTEERINAHLYKLNKKDFPELLEDLYITGGHPLLVDDKDLDEETKKKLLDMIDYGTPIITEGKYRAFACVHPKAELWNDEKEHEIFDIVLENEDPKKNYGIWVNGILTESMDEEYFLNKSKMTEI